MKTNFSPRMLAEADLAEAQGILSKCTNCGCCNAACPTYEVTGDERESPRGRINLIREMLEDDRSPEADVVQHIDSCLSCLSCTVACPSGVDYMHLVDYARVHIEQRHQRPMGARATRSMLSEVLPKPARFRAAMTVGKFARPLAGALNKLAVTRTLGAMLASVPAAPPRESAVESGVHRAKGTPVRRVIVPSGCVQPTLDPAIDRSATSLLTSLGVEVVVPPPGLCCGALNYHLGKREVARDQARANISAWLRIMDAGPVDAIVITASGCGTTVMDYAHMLRDDPDYADKAARVAALAVDVTAFVGSLDLPEPKVKPGLRVAYHAACSLQHGQKLLNEPKNLLRRAGFTVLSPKDEHLCCGSAGTYSILHPETAADLRDRKVGTLEQTRPDVIAGGNIGCLQHLGAAAQLPVLHTVMLLDWAWTGAVPQALAQRASQDTATSSTGPNGPWIPTEGSPSASP